MSIPAKDDWQRLGSGIWLNNRSRDSDSLFLKLWVSRHLEACADDVLAVVVDSDERFYFDARYVGDYGSNADSHAEWKGEEFNFLRWPRLYELCTQPDVVAALEKLRGSMTKLLNSPHPGLNK